MKKYEVKVGEPFKGSITVVIIQDKVHEQPFCRKSATFVLLVAVAAVIVVAGYGLVTGDYSPFKAVAERLSRGLVSAIELLEAFAEAKLKK